MRKSILEQQIEKIGGKKVLCYVKGKYAPFDKRSNLHMRINDFGYTTDDIGTKIAIAVGAKRQHKSEGYLMAIIEL